MTRTKISPWTAGLALAVAGSLTFAGAAMAQQAQKLRLGIVIDVTKSLGGEFATTFANVAKEKSGGRVEVAIFDKGQLGGEKEMVASMQLGELDFALVNGALLSTVDPSYMATEMPFIWRTREQAHAAFDGEIGQKMRTQLEAKGIRVLGVGEWGYRQLLMRKPVKTMADLKGMKVRVAETPLFVSTWRALGTNPVPMAWTEVYTGFQQGSIDAVDTNPIGMADAKLFEVAKHLLITNHIFTSLALSMSAQKYKALPADLQAALNDAAKAGQAANRARADDADKQAIDVMQKNGVEVIRLDLGPLREATAPVLDQFRPQIGADLLSAVVNAGK